jgi:hypothetical protein
MKFSIIALSLFLSASSVLADQGGGADPVYDYGGGTCYVPLSNVTCSKHFEGVHDPHVGPEFVWKDVGCNGDGLCTAGSWFCSKAYCETDGTLAPSNCECDHQGD